MPDPITFDSVSPRFNLPFLWAGQAQKEVFVNEALARLDALLHCAIESESASPPASPGDGQAWLVATSPTGEWAGKAGQIAYCENGAWRYAVPCDGMRVLNRSTGQELRFFVTWQKPVAPAEPSGGSVVDVQARSAILSLVTALRATGVLPAA